MKSSSVIIMVVLGVGYPIILPPRSPYLRVNIQNFKGEAKPYQVRQVLKAIARLKEKSNA